LREISCRVTSVAMSDTVNLSVVVPVFNEDKNVAKLVDEIALAK